MKTKPRQLTILLACLHIVVVSCNSRTRIQKMESYLDPDNRPRQMQIYIDCSYSVRGFFHSFTGETQAKELLTNISGQALRDDIPTLYHKFDKKCDSVAGNFNEFSRLGLRASFFECKENQYSAALQSMLFNLDSDAYKDGIFLVFSDGVPSIKSDDLDFGVERAKLSQILSNFKKNFPNYGLGLFHYRFAYHGRYPLQPDFIKGTRSQIEYKNLNGSLRNFYVLAFYPLKYQGYLNTLLDRKPSVENQQFFHRALTPYVSLTSLCTPNLIANNRFSLLLGGIPNKMEISPEKLSEMIQIRDTETAQSLSPSVAISKFEGDEWKIDIDLSEKEKIEASVLSFQLIGQNRLHPVWDTLTNKQKFESFENYDSTKTYKLNVLTEAFEEVFSSSNVFETKLVLSSDLHSFFGMPYIWIFGEEEDITWDNYLYLELCGILLVMTVIAILIFYFSGWFDSSTQPLWSWVRLGMIAGALCFAFTFILILSTKATGCENSFTIFSALFYALYNSLLFEGLFFLASIIFKGRNATLQNVPI